MSVKIFGNGKIEGVAVEKKRIEAFTGSGTFTVPAGVTYAIAHMLGGGGGFGGVGTGGDGGASSVAFASGTVTANGMPKASANNGVTVAFAGKANTGVSGSGMRDPEGAVAAASNNYVVAGAAVTPAASITVTVGAGGSAGSAGAAGGSGYVYIEYFEEA